MWLIADDDGTGALSGIGVWRNADKRLISREVTNLCRFGPRVWGCISGSYQLKAITWPWDSFGIKSSSGNFPMNPSLCGSTIFFEAIDMRLKQDTNEVTTWSPTKCAAINKSLLGGVASSCQDDRRRRIQGHTKGNRHRASHEPRSIRPWIIKASPVGAGFVYSEWYI